VDLHVLVVDDDELSRRLVERVLAAQGFAVELVDSATAAFAAIERRRPDLIVLDVMMPGISGAEMLEQVKSNPRLTSIPIIMVTGRTSDDDLIASYRSGADYYITKPLKSAELLYGVSLVLGLHMEPSGGEIVIPRSDRPRSR
jgi:DNA-binding response OmpR family regulator